MDSNTQTHRGLQETDLGDAFQGVHAVHDRTNRALGALFIANEGACFRKSAQFVREEEKAKYTS